MIGLPVSLGIIQVKDIPKEGDIIHIIPSMVVRSYHENLFGMTGRYFRILDRGDDCITKRYGYVPHIGVSLIKDVTRAVRVTR
jgi:hypothetical protein